MAQKPETPQEAFARQVRATRERRRWTQEDLAEALDRLGAGIDRSVIARIEGGTRRVTLDAALAIALALEVAPIHLFIPREDVKVRLAPKLTVSSRHARRWASGRQAFGFQDPYVFSTEVPEEDWRAMQQDAYRSARQLEDTLDMLLTRPEEAPGRETALKHVEELANETVARVRRLIELEQGS